MARRNTVGSSHPVRSPVRTAGAVLGVIASGFYLLNLSFGLVEIPDYLPVIGNLDEVAVSAFFYGCMSYLGINLIPFQRKARGTGSPTGRQQ